MTDDARLTVATPDGLVSADASVTDRSDHLRVHVDADAVGTSDLANHTITVSGPPTGDGPIGRVERPWTYHGVVDRVTEPATASEPRLTLCCTPPRS
jgi:hypothetical protein